ncbi:MAG: tetratricopeptide repeat protein [Acidimicrobiales bacterium]
MAQSGARRESEPEPERPRRPREPLSPEEEAKRLERAARREAKAADQARLRAEAKDAVDRAESRRRGPRGKKPSARSALPKVPLSLDEPEVAIARLVGADRSARYVRALGEASQSFARERFQDARRQLAPAVRTVPDVPEVAELQGLIQYRLGNWKAASDQLERFRTLSGTTEQHPVLADCYRALGRYADVEELWDELRAASPSADLVTEGRIVAAGALADQDRLPEALALLEKGWNRPKRPKPHHLRRAYALADLYERNGRAPRARELFRWIETNEPGFADVHQRVAAL